MGFFQFNLEVCKKSNKRLIHSQFLPSCHEGSSTWCQVVDQSQMSSLISQYTSHQTIVYKSNPIHKPPINTSYTKKWHYWALLTKSKSPLEYPLLDNVKITMFSKNKQCSKKSNNTSTCEILNLHCTIRKPNYKVCASSQCPKNHM